MGLGTVSRIDNSSHATLVDGTVYLPRYHTGDIVIVYAVADKDVGLTIADGSYTQLYEDVFHPTAPPSLNGTVHCAAWWWLADSNNTVANLAGPGITTVDPDFSLIIAMSFRAIDIDTGDPVPWFDPPIALSSRADISSSNRGVGGVADTVSLDPLGVDAPFTGNHMWVTLLAGGASIGNTTAPTDMTVLDSFAFGSGSNGVRYIVWDSGEMSTGDASTFDPSAVSIGTTTPFAGNFWIAATTVRTLVMSPTNVEVILAYWGINATTPA